MSVEQKAVGGRQKAEAKGRTAPPRGRTPIGLDLGARRVKAIQLEHGPEGPRVAAAAVAPRAGAGGGPPGKPAGGPPGGGVAGAGGGAGLGPLVPGRGVGGGGG